MNKIVEELRQTGVLYVATVEGDQPRVRPFSSLTEIDGQLYICTNNKKDCFKQMMDNSKVEICGMKKDNTWIRISGTVVRDEREEAKKAMLEDPTGPSQFYTLGDQTFEVLRVENAVCTKYSFTEAPAKVEA